MRFHAALAVLLFSSVSAFAADVTGAWNFSVDTPNGKFESTVELKQEGDKVSGTLHNQFGDSPVTGTVKESDFSLVQKLDMNGQSMTITYEGKVDAGTPAKITGKFKFGDQGEGDFSATKK
jgi:hypothetical protein